MNREWIAGQPPRAGPAAMIARGLLTRCARCGAKHVFASAFRLHERCPRCGCRFQREEGFWLGAYIINFAIAEGLIGLVLFGYIIVAANNPSVSTGPVYVAGAAAALLAPVAFFRLSRTLWSAIDLIMRPLEPAEVAEAILSVEEITPPA